MAINYIGSAVSDSGTIDLTGISMQPDDIVIVISGEDAGAPALATGYTSIAVTSSTGDIRYMYKIMPNPVDSSVTGLTNASDCGHLAMVFRGVDTTDPIDTFQTSAGISGDPNPPSITPTVDGCMIVAMGFLDDDLISTPSPPTDFTLSTFNTFGSTGEGGSVMGAYFSQTTAGTINPTAFNTDGSDWWGAITIALTPEPVNYVQEYGLAYTRNYIASDLTGRIKVWNGSSWDLKPVKVWNGTAWLNKPVKRWNGTSWAIIHQSDLTDAYVPDLTYDRAYSRAYTGTQTVFYGGYTGTGTAFYSNNYVTDYTVPLGYSRAYTGAVFYGGFGGSTGTINYVSVYGTTYVGIASYAQDYTAISYDRNYAGV